MIGIGKPWFAAALTVTLILTTWASANAEDPKSEGKKETKEAKGPDGGDIEREGDASPGRRGSEGARRPARPGDHLVGQYTRLRDEMRDTLKLTPAQEEKIDALFEGQMQALRRRGQFREGGENSPDPEAEVKLLRDRMRDARERGDSEAVNKLREEIRVKNEALYTARAAGMQTFLGAVRDELNDAQQEKFQEIVTRLRLDGGPRGSGQELGRLMRAVRDPKVGATEAQLGRINEILRDGLSRSESGAGVGAEKWDANKVDESIRRVHERVLKELSSDQRKAVEEILAQPPADRLERAERRGDRDRPRRERSPSGKDDD